MPPVGDVRLDGESGRHSVDQNLRQAPSTPTVAPPHFTSPARVNMSQEPSAEERGRNSSHQPQRNGFAPMSPFDTFGADRFARSPVANPVPFSPRDVPVHRSLNPSPYSAVGSPFQLPMAGMYSPMMARTEVYRGATTNSPRPRAEFTLPGEYRPLYQGRPPVWPTYAPGYNAPVNQMYSHSRLPPNDVARKAPRKSTAHSPPQKGTLQRSNSDLKSAKARKGKPEASLKREPSPTPQHEEVAQTGQRKHRKTYRTPAISSASTRRRKRVILDDEDDEDDEDDDGHDGDGGNEANVPIPSIESGITEGPASATRAATPATRRSKRIQAPQIQRPHPRYEYLVPSKLEGIKQALGEEDWIEYLIGTEKKLLGEITEDEFDARSKHLFLVFDEQTRRRIEKLVGGMIAPVIKQHAEEEVKLGGVGQAYEAENRMP
jgi:hypothetical protein